NPPQLHCLEMRARGCGASAGVGLQKSVRNAECGTCFSPSLYVIQVTWQKETAGAEDNIATYSTINGQKIAKAYVSHVSFAHSELQASAISLHGVTLQDEGCYKCIFNTFPSGAVTGRMCLKVYGKLIPNPDKAEDSEKMVGMSCSATGKPAPKITWHLPSILQQKPREYHIKFSNQTVTVINPKHRSAGNATCVHHAGMCSFIHPISPQGMAKGCLKWVSGCFFLLHAHTEYLLLSPQVQTAAWHHPWQLLLHCGSWSP
uniref:OX-2 membrane glycoprotein-like n=1 Tax=Taeniopygia guttata TaxID=59729 RepID=A0A674G7F7_TAEGU